MKQFVLFAIVTFIVISCSNKNDKLPILGRRVIENVNFDDGIKADTIFHTISDFHFTDQDGQIVTQETFQDKIYIADFFFTTCPTICPIMKTQMLRVYKKYKDNPNVLILSHTIDPKHDSVTVLEAFAERLGVSSDTWHFVTGNQDEIYDIGQNSYMVTAREDKNAPGGNIHSGAFILVDKKRRIRGMYDGTKEDIVDELIIDIGRLLKENDMK